jgi:post-segregation antitoxin (ccd killing protein)
MTRRRARLAAAVASACLALLLSGCQAKATVSIRMRADGRGTVAVSVVLDREARLALAGAALKPGATTPDVPLDDLRASGWSVSTWRPVEDGGSAVELSKGFTGREGLVSVLAELDGRDGALREVRVVRDRDLLRDRDRVSLLADLTDVRIGISDDEELAARLRAAGVDVAAIDAGIQARVKDSFDLTVRVELPDGRAGTVRVEPGEEQRLAVASTTDHPGRRWALIAAASGAFLAVVLFVFAAIQARRSRRARRGRRSRRRRRA